MSLFRREFLKLVSSGAAGAAAAAVTTMGAQAFAAPMPNAGAGSVFDVRQYGAKGDGTTIDSPAINKAIEAANASGGLAVVVRCGDLDERGRRGRREGRANSDAQLETALCRLRDGG